MAHGELTHIDIPADDLERAKRFYVEIFGWDIAQLPDMPDFELFMSGPGDAGWATACCGRRRCSRGRRYARGPGRRDVRRARLLGRFVWRFADTGR